MIDADHPDLYSSFLRFEAGFATWLEERKGQTPSRSALLDANASKFLSVSVGDLKTLSAISRDTVAVLDELARELTAYTGSRRSQQLPIDTTLLKNLEEKRLAIIAAAVDKLQASLSPNSWAALRTYINNTHRSSVRKLVQP